MDVRVMTGCNGVGAAADLDKVGEFGIPLDDQLVNLRLQLLLLGVLEGGVELGKTCLALTVLQQEEMNHGREGEADGLDWTHSPRISLYAMDSTARRVRKPVMSDERRGRGWV